ncbi:MAG: response regulator [Syntrophobacteraceae bacterium]
MAIHRIILADDHQMMRQGVKRIIEARPNLKVIAEAGDGLELLRLLMDVVPDLVIVDIAMPNLRGIEAAREIKSSYPDTKILILTMHKDQEFLRQAIAAGADGYLLKEDADIELYSAIDTISRGGHYISPILSGTVTDGFLHLVREPHRRDQHTPQAQTLTTRESEILQLIAEGNSSMQIARLLGISVRTAENHRSHIMRKLGLRKNIHLVRYAIRRGYLPDSAP